MGVRHGRLPWLDPSELDEAQRAVYDAICGGPRAQGPQPFRLIDAQGRLEGPFNAMVTLPGLGAWLQGLGSAIRYGTSLSDRVREAAILLVASHHRSAFEWYAHERIGRAQGLTDEELAALSGGQIPPTFDEAEHAAAEVVVRLLSNRDLDDDEFASASVWLDTSALMELVVLVGYYQLLALQLAVWRTPLPDGASSPY